MDPAAVAGTPRERWTRPLAEEIFVGGTQTGRSDPDPCGLSLRCALSRPNFAACECATCLRPACPHTLSNGSGNRTQRRPKVTMLVSDARCPGVFSLMVCVSSLMVLWSSPSFAEQAPVSGGPSTDECLSAHEAAQRQERQGKLIEAHREFLSCAQDTCPPVLRAECAERVERVESRIPSVVFVLREADGRDVSQGTVRVGGEVVSQGLDGRATRLNPGGYEFEFTTADGRQVKHFVLVKDGDTSREVLATLPPKPALSPASRAAPSEEQRPIWPAVVGFSVAAVGAGVFATFAALGKSEEGFLADCAPRCAPTEDDAMRTYYLIGDIGLAAGALSAGFGVTWLLLGKPSVAAAAANTDTTGAHTSAVSGGPTLGLRSRGGGLLVEGVF